jgi:hypothetical protein
MKQQHSRTLFAQSNTNWSLCIHTLRHFAIIPLVACNHTLGRLQSFPYELDHVRALWAGFEPARAEPNRFQVYRLNHSATTARGKK